MHFTVLGPLSVHDDVGHPITPRPSKLRTLLALFLIDANTLLLHEHLVDRLWEDDPPRTALTALQVYVSRLRHLLGPAHPGSPNDLLVTRSGGYLLDPTGHTLDADLFTALYRQARAADAAGRPERAYELLGRSLTHWSGPALADVRHNGPLARRAAVLEEWRRDAQDRRITLGLRMGRHTRLVGEITELVDRDPLHEDLCGHLMLALHRSGRTAEALLAYQRLRGALVRERGREPGAPLRRLHRAILGRDPALDDLRSLAPSTCSAG